MKNGKALILVVEDNPLIRMGAVDLVLFVGYEVLEAENADTAIAILESTDAIDLVFTDVQMPGAMNGVILSQYIRNRWPQVRLIIASGLELLDESSLPDGSRFLLKPYSDHAVYEAMADLLAADTEPAG